MDWKKTLGAIAPTLATALGGPLAGAATKFLASELLGDENASTEAIEAAVTGASPEQLAKLKQLDVDFKLGMKKLDVDVFAIEAEDKSSARKNNSSSNMPSILAIGLTLVVATLLYALFYIEPPEGAREPLLIVLGMVVKEWSNSMHYWFGTTRSSSDKNKLLQ